MRNLLMIAAGVAVFLAAPVSAEVTNTADNGFTVQHTAVANGSVKDVWKALIAPSRWWNGDHTWSGNSENLYLVAQAGGCFCELIKKDPDANISTATGSVEHMRVVMVQREEVMRLSGALGPLQGEAVSGTLTIELQPAKTGARTGMRFTYKVGGYMDLKVEDIAPAVDGVIGEQLTRLAALFVEDNTGEEPDAPDAEDASN